MERFMEKMGDKGDFDPVKYPIVFFNMLTMPRIIVSDPMIVRDLYVTKNAISDKDGMTELQFSDLIGNSFIFSHNDARWKAKRKACAHAFYKERLEMMIEVLKDKVEASVEKFLSQARESPEGIAIMDFEREFSDMLSRNIVHICFGQDISQETLVLWK